MYKNITVLEFKEKYLKSPEKLEIIDVREPYEFKEVRIKWSKLISMWELWKKLNEIDWNKEVIFVCRSWARSWHVSGILSENWYKPNNLSGWIQMLTLNCKECMESGEINEKYFE